ncbi:MAG: restriction endonuclease [Planctomycetes bacterium]|nr:restriction endonuclease [Planctomycetota bacterium]
MPWANFGRHSDPLREIEDSVEAVDSAGLKTKRSKGKTMRGRMLYSPRLINTAFKREPLTRKWEAVRVPCEYSGAYDLPEYTVRFPSRGAFREMDFVKQKLGLEVQFGKYAFMVYNVCAEMTIFRNLGFIEFGVEIVPVKAFAEEMSTGVSCLEQFIWDLETRGVSDIDIPVMILGVDA